MNIVQSVLDNSLFTLNYHDDEQYQIRRSSTKKRIVKNHESKFIFEYKIFIWISRPDDGYYQDMGTIHQSDLVNLLESRKIAIDEVIIK